MPLIRLINPNTSPATTAMMAAIARDALPPGFDVVGVTAGRGVPMILDEAQLAAAADGVVAMGLTDAGGVDGVIVGAFGDPGIENLRRAFARPVAGICEASMIEAAAGGRRFGIATVTPGLVRLLAGKAEALGLAPLFAGTRLTGGDPEALAADPGRLEEALADVVERCFTDDRADAVIIGGGPLGQAATALAGRFPGPVIAPIPAAARRLLSMLRG